MDVIGARLLLGGGWVEVHCHCGCICRGVPNFGAHAWLPWVARCPRCGRMVTRDDSERLKQEKEDANEP